jgi:alkylation response protein AidB-like acyl-CoA dehydrogenase
VYATVLNTAPESLFRTLASGASKWRTKEDWPLDSLRLCGQHGLFRGLAGAVPADKDRRPWTSVDQIETLIQLAKADLLTTFVITQHVGAIKRILGSDQLAGGEDQSEIGRKILPRLFDGGQIASVGISHLTTSRMHLGRPAVSATPVAGGYRLAGTIPWVTGAPLVQQMVVGATLADQTQILVLLSPDHEGVTPGRGAAMITMSASCTDAVELQDVFVADSKVLSGPRDNVLIRQDQATDAPTGAGGLQTSALALGLSYAALDYLRQEAIRRNNLVPIVDRFNSEHRLLHETIRRAAGGDGTIESNAVRATANGLVQRTTGAAMTTAKGAGLMIDHAVGRWCQQALFFLVWSCPQTVAETHLCDLVGLE